MNRVMNLALAGLILVFALLPAYTAAADDAPIHLIDAGQTGYGPTVSDAMNERVERTADDYQQYAPVPRVALIDFAAPKDPEEYAVVDGYGVLLVTVLSQEKDELPPKRLYVQIDGKQVDLQLFTSGFEAESGSSKVQKVLGKYRWDGLYYFPIYLPIKGQALVIDYAKNRSGFVLQQFNGAQGAPDWLAPLAKPPHGDKPPLAAFTALVAREYPGFFTSEN